MNPSFKELIERAKKTFEYVLEGAILSFTENVARVMGESGVSKRELAKRIDCSAPYVTKVLRGNPNLTIASMVKIAQALDCELSIELQPKIVQQTQAITIFDANKESANNFVRRRNQAEFVVADVGTVQHKLVNPISSGNSELALAA